MHLKDNLFSTEFRFEVGLKAIKQDSSIDDLAKEYNIKPELVLQFKESALSAATCLFEADRDCGNIENKLNLILENEHFKHNGNIFEKAVLRNTLNVINITDINTYEILYMNKSCRKAYNISRYVDYKYQKCYKLFYGFDSPCDFCPNNKIREKGYHNWKILNPYGNKHYDIYDNLINIDGREVILEVGIDIDDNEMQIKQLDHKVQLDETLFDCIRTLTESVDLQQAINKMLEIVCTYYDGERGYIFELNKDGTLLNNTYEWCKDGISAEIDNLKDIPKEVASHWFVHFKNSGSFFISNLNDVLSKNSDDYKILEAQGITSLMAAPLIEHGVIKGFIGVDNPSSYVDNFSLLSSVTYFIVNDIQKRRMLKDLEIISYVDSLTQLYNRNRYLKDLEQIEYDKPETIGVIYIDVNGLKIANDKFGHDYGDYLLKQVSDVIISIFNKNMYRVGGDEFVILCPNASKPSFENRI